MHLLKWLNINIQVDHPNQVSPEEHKGCLIIAKKANWHTKGMASSTGWGLGN